MELTDEIKIARDRITKLLRPSQPTVQDIGDAIFRVRVGKSSFGEELNKTRATKQVEALKQYEVLGKERRALRKAEELDLKKRRQKIQLDRLEWDKTKGNSEAIRKTMESYLPNAADRHKVGAYVKSLGIPVGADNAHIVIPRAIEKLAGDGRIRVQKMGSKEGKRFSDRQAILKQFGPRAAVAFDAMTKSSGKGAFGASMVGQAYNTLLEEKAYKGSGQAIPSELQTRSAVARHILGTKKFFRDPEGNLMSYQPGVPKALAGDAPKAHKITEEIPKAPPGNYNAAMQTMSRIADILDEAKQARETITGITGWAKKVGGGFARQAGIPITVRAERLGRQLEVLQGIVGPLVLNEKRLSETERDRLKRIVGDLSPSMDEDSLRSALVDVYNVLESLAKK